MQAGGSVPGRLVKWAFLLQEQVDQGEKKCSMAGDLVPPSLEKRGKNGA